MARFKPLPSQEELRKELVYNPESGQLYRAERTADDFNGNAMSAKFWNSRYAGRLVNTPKTENGYLGISFKGKPYAAHRLIWKLVHGEDPNVIDHINGNRSDNRIENLRSVTFQENSKNSARAHHAGDTYCLAYKRGKPPRWKNNYQRNEMRMAWRVMVTIDGKHVEVYRTSQKPDAIKARNELLLVYGYHPNHGRKRRKRGVEVLKQRESYSEAFFPGNSNTWEIKGNRLFY